jgi:adenylate cyclase
VSETRKLAAILVSDVVGYSRLAGADEDRILARLRTLRSDLIDPTIAVHHGRVVKRTGDGSIIEFRSVVDAVNCAVELQRAMVERNAEVAPDKRIEFRIGIHLGDVVEEADGDLMGDGVNIAARLQGVANPGGICISDDAFRQVKSRLDLKVSDLGPVPLKNIAEPMRAYSLEVGAPPDARSPPADQAKSAPKRRLSFASLAAVATLLLLVASGGWYMLMGRAPKPVEAAHLSIVVLPFANLSGDPSQDYFADALTDELTTAISRIQDTFVIARNTASTYKGKPVDAKAIGKELRVRYVLEGSVQPSGNQVRVNAQLIDAESGAHLWADQLDTPRADVLQMQDEIVARLVRAMFFQLNEVEAARLKRTPPANTNAEDLALQCSAALLKTVVTPKDAETGFRLCEQALAADPNNVTALTFLALKFLPSGGRGFGPGDDLKRADELLSKALALDPNYFAAHDIKALVLESQFRFDEAIAEEQRAVVLAPGDMFAYDNMGYAYRRLGQFEKSLEFVDKAIRLSPHDRQVSTWYADKAAAHLALKQYDQAIEWGRRTLAISPNNGFAHTYLIVALALSDHESEAHEALQRALAIPEVGQERTMLERKAAKAQWVNEHTDPRYVEYWDRLDEGLRKAGLPEE